VGHTIGIGNAYVIYNLTRELCFGGTLWMSEIKKILSEIKGPEKLYSRDTAIISRTQHPFTENKGVYAWYFKKKPHRKITLENCHSVEWKNQTLHMLYVGIAPNSDVSNQTLRKRIQFHYKRNIYGSNLRRSLASLLKNELSLFSYRSGKRNRLRLCNDGEGKLSEWIFKNAFVTWSYVKQPWQYEKEIITSLYLPLNLQYNQKHPFYDTLSKKRKKF